MNIRLRSKRKPSKLWTNFQKFQMNINHHINRHYLHYLNLMYENWFEEKGLRANQRVIPFPTDLPDLTIFSKTGNIILKILTLSTAFLHTRYKTIKKMSQNQSRSHWREAYNIEAHIDHCWEALNKGNISWIQQTKYANYPKRNKESGHQVFHKRKRERMVWWKAT